MGLSFGSQKSQSTATNQQDAKYSEGQTGLQDTLLSAFQSLLPGLKSGGISPNVTAIQTQNADTINKTSAGMGERMQKFLAGRGFGQSGEGGKAQLQTELGRVGALAGNNAAAGQMQLNQNSTLLSDALAAAYKAMGYTGTETSNSKGSKWGASGSVAFGF